MEYSTVQVVVHIITLRPELPFRRRYWCNFQKKKSLLPGPMMTNNSDAMWHHWATFNQFHKIAVTCVLSTGFVAT